MTVNHRSALIEALRTPASRRTVLRRVGLGSLTAAVATRLRPTPAQAQSTPVATPVTTGEWPAHGHDVGGMRHSPLTQIDRDNVGELQVAWTFHTGELETYQGTNFPIAAVAFEAV